MDHVFWALLRRPLLIVLLLLIANKSAIATPLGLPSIKESEPHNNELISLGKELFFDKSLSDDGSISCASCHDPLKAFSDGRAIAIGIGNRPGTRNTPSLFNARYSTSFFWDGRRASLEVQALDPLVNPREHGFRNVTNVETIVSSKESYRNKFKRAFGSDKIASSKIADALAGYQRTLLAGDSAFDRYFYRNEKNAMTSSAQRGFDLFKGRAGCSSCHSFNKKSALFTDNDFHSLGIGQVPIASGIASLATQVASADAAQLDLLIKSNKDISELGHFVVTKNPQDIGKFKTPSLRNVAVTAPYMHDGSIETLEKAVAFELHWTSRRLNAVVVVTPAEQQDLLEFLRALTSPGITHQ